MAIYDNAAIKAEEADIFVLAEEAAEGVNEIFIAGLEIPKILGTNTVHHASTQPDLMSLYDSMKQDAELQSLKLQHNNLPSDMKQILQSFKDPKIDPASDQFDHRAFFKTVREFAKSMKMDMIEMPIAFRDLRIVGNTLEKAEIPTVGSAFLGFIQPALHIYRFFKAATKSILPKKLSSETEIIKGISGAIKPGEVVLVIGRPGSGCSSLLRVLANQTRNFKIVLGEIRYAGYTSKEISEQYAADIIYAQEDDPHYPSLTVRQTLEFAASCRYENKNIIRQVVDLTLKIYGLVNCQNTVVGDSTLRGVSGGEKRRVSLAEATIVGGPAGIFDGCTKGLDAASSLDFVKALRSFADFQNRAVVASCYQASNAMFLQFDKVIILADGECTYFGPIHDAVSYFENLGFQRQSRETFGEFLTNCASCRKISPADLAASFRNSLFGAAAVKDADYYLSQEVMQTFRKEFVTSRTKKQAYLKASSGSEKPHPEGKYSTSYCRQINLLINHSIVFYGIMAIIVGSIYFGIPKTPTGAYTRGGAIFFALLFNLASAMREIPNIMAGRSILYKHVDMAMYRPSALFLAQYIFSFFQDTIQTLMFCTILYFMVGLQTDAGKYFTFILIVMTGQQSFGQLLRMIAFLCEDTASAQQKAGIFFIAFQLYAGYTIPHQYMKPWFVWIYWMNPIAYGFKSLMINEFDGLLFQCSSSDLVPAGPTYTNILYQSCSMAGSTTGSATVDGLSYLSVALDIDTSMKWWNVLINVGIFILLFSSNLIIVELVRHSGAALNRKFFKPPENQEKLLDKLKFLDRKVEPEKKTADGTVTVELDGIDGAEALKTLIWSEVVYSVPHPKNKKESLQLLDHICGYARPGTMTALMGSSGAGKTTLLDVIGMRKTTGKIEGIISVGCNKQGPEFRKISGYCEQIDLFNKDETVREALLFGAFLRQPASILAKEKMAYVEKIISLLGLESVGDALIGDLDSGIGLSMEERKRLTIGLELVAKPKILFLDEPTSGLDDQAASSVIKLLKALATEEYALVVTIHQPSVTLFNSFDRLLLLGRGGKTLYFGQLGEDSRTLIEYFERNGSTKCEPDENPAEYILECIGAGTGVSKNTINWPAVWRTSAECQAERETVDSLKLKSEKFSQDYAAQVEKQNARLIKDTPSTTIKTLMVMRRMFRTYWRSPAYNLGRIVFQTICSLLVGLTFFQCDSTIGGAQNRVFAIFMSSGLAAVAINVVIPMFNAQRAYSSREQNAGAYGPAAFGIAVTTVEIPFAILAATAYFVLFYWTVGLNANSSNTGYFYLMYILFVLWAVSFGQMAASAAPNASSALAVVPIATCILSLFQGVSITYDSMPSFYKYWLYWIDPYHYFAEGLMVNDLSGVALHCDSYSYVQVSIPSGYTCGQYFTAYQAYGAPGIVADSVATGSCLWCPIQIGDTYYSKFSWSYDNRWRNAGILFAFWIFNRIMAAIFIKRYKVKR